MYRYISEYGSTPGDTDPEVEADTAKLKTIFTRLCTEAGLTPPQGQVNIIRLKLVFVDSKNTNRIVSVKIQFLGGLCTTSVLVRLVFIPPEMSVHIFCK